MTELDKKIKLKKAIKLLEKSEALLLDANRHHLHEAVKGIVECIK